MKTLIKMAEKDRNKGGKRGKADEKSSTPGEVNFSHAVPARVEEVIAVADQTAG